MSAVAIDAGGVETRIRSIPGDDPGPCKPDRSDPEPATAMPSRFQLLQNLRRYESLNELHQSPFYVTARESIEDILTRPDIETVPAVRPRLKSFLRVIQWNIEKGTRFDEIVACLSRHHTLRWADLILLNEADWGMARSANRHVARDLARELGMHMVFGAAHLELTKGTEDDLLAPGENLESLQGNAILTRYPIVDARVERLPACFEPYHFHEKRYGGRNCVWARIRTARGFAWVGSVHLEVRETPACRARQVAHLMTRLPGGPEAAYLLGGDLNTNGFRRGTPVRTVASVWRLISKRPSDVNRELCRPDSGREPLFRLAERAGFSWAELNSRQPTAWASLESLEDAKFLPEIVRRKIQRRLQPYGGYLHMKLDWFLGRGVNPLEDNELIDPETAVVSSAPGRVALEHPVARRVSDHQPIHLDLSFPAA